MLEGIVCACCGARWQPTWFACGECGGKYVVIDKDWKPTQLQLPGVDRER